MGARKILFQLRKQFLRALSSCLSRNEPLPTPAAPSARKAGGQKFLPPHPLPFCPPAGNPPRFFRTAAGRQNGRWVGLVFFAFSVSSALIFCNETLYPYVSNLLFAFLKLTLLKNGISNSLDDELIIPKII